MNGALQRILTVAGRGCVASLALALVLHGSTKRPVVRKSAAPDPTAMRTLTDADFARGFVMTRMGRGETYDFTPPANAVICSDWQAFGAAEDWVYLSFTNWVFQVGTNATSRLRVCSSGRIEPLVPTVPGSVAADSWLAPLSARLGIVPEANWPLLGECGGPSRFWYASTPQGSQILTWQNALLDRLALRPVSFQAELFSDGRFAYRYDLSHLTVESVSATVGAHLAGGEWATNGLPVDITSVTFQPLTEVDRYESDPDGDGLSTVDELFRYGTDPHNPDTDCDGLSDADELLVYGTDPLNPNSLCPGLCDGYAVLVGGLDPLAPAPGSTNAVLERVFYAGSLSGPSEPPRPTESCAILRVRAAGSGTGDLIVGDRPVPLVTARDGYATPELLVPVVRGQTVPLALRGGDDLRVELDADELLIGERPSTQNRRGWLAFPQFRTTEPCIHDLCGGGRIVSLVHEGKFPGLSATWSGNESDVIVSNLPPSAAAIYGRFRADGERPLTCTIDHAHRLNRMAVTRLQSARFCPRVAVCPSGSLDDGDPLASPVCACGTARGCQCGGFPGCACPVQSCPCRDGFAGEDVDAAVEYTNLVLGAVAPVPNVLRLHGANTQTMRIEPPTAPSRPCCPCPEHDGGGYASLVSLSDRVEVRMSDGVSSAVVHEPGTAVVVGVSPSAVMGDASVLLVTNGTVSIRRDYTVLGVGFATPPGYPDLGRLNDRLPSVGYPFAAASGRGVGRLRLLTDILLSNGVIRVALEGAGREAFRIWLPAWRDGDEDHPAEILLDGAAESERYFHIRDWRRIVSRYGAGVRSLEIEFESSSEGTCTLALEYAASDGEGRVVRDAARQRVTAIGPLLLPDYDRDGAIGAADEALRLAGRTFRYWVNEDFHKGDYIGQVSDLRSNTDLDSGVAKVRGRLDLVNLFPVRIGSSLITPMDDGFVSLKIRSKSANLRYCFVDLNPIHAGDIYRLETCTMEGGCLSEANMRVLPSEWTPLSELGALKQSILVCEAVGPISPKASIEVLLSIAGTEVVHENLPSVITSVREMYRFYSLRGAESENGEFTLPSRPWVDSYEDEIDADIFFTHGFNVSEDEAHMWGDAVFKRLWLSGVRARFHMLTWNGNYNWTGNWANGLHYQQDVYQALRTGNAMRRLLEREQPNQHRRILMAQSLGNMVACEALRQGLHVAKYFMFNAALASECLDGSLQNADPLVRKKYVPFEWRDYDALSWSANWHRWFATNLDDSRSRLGWVDRYSKALNHAAEVYNYYSTGDEVFHETANPPWLLEGMTDSTSNYAWQKQETLKGGRGLAGTAYGGWGFHFWRIAGFDYHYTSTEALEMVTDGSITNNPIFNRGYTPMLTQRFNLAEEMCALAKYVPAVSSPVGGMPVFTSDEHAADLNSNRFRAGWTLDSARGNGWKHSDMKDMAYIYVWPLYDEIVKEKGGLK